MSNSFQSNTLGSYKVDQNKTQVSFIIIILNIFYWSIVDLQCCVVSHIEQSESITYISTLFYILFPYRPLHSTEWSSPCYTVGSETGLLLNFFLMSLKLCDRFLVKLLLFKSINF